MTNRQRDGLDILITAEVTSTWRCTGRRPLLPRQRMPLFRRIPKRGVSNGSWAKNFHIVNVGDLQCFPDGSVIDQATLDQTGLAQGPADGVRVLGTGDLSRKLTVRASHFSKSAQEKIEKAGGIAELVALPKPPVRNKMKPRPAKS